MHCHRDLTFQETWRRQTSDCACFIIQATLPFSVRRLWIWGRLTVSIQASVLARPWGPDRLCPELQTLRAPPLHIYYVPFQRWALPPSHLFFCFSASLPVPLFLPLLLPPASLFPSAAVFRASLLLLFPFFLTFPFPLIKTPLHELCCMTSLSCVPLFFLKFTTLTELENRRALF